MSLIPHETVIDETSKVFKNNEMFLNMIFFSDDAKKKLLCSKNENFLTVN